MTYAQALMIVRNPESGYPAEKIKEAAVFILGSLHAKQEDILQATTAFFDNRRVRTSA